MKGAPPTPRPRPPAAPETPLRDALAAYLADNGFTTRAYEENIAKLGFFGLPVWIPNTPGRKRGLPLHDLHHVALGFGTDLVGECEISAWELRAGARGFGPFVLFLITQAAVMGLVLSPRRTLAAWRAARGCRSLYAAGVRPEDVLSLTVGELRAMLGVHAPPVSGARHDSRECATPS